jgi:hypothetical protein
MDGEREDKQWEPERLLRSMKTDVMAVGSVSQTAPREQSKSLMEKRNY